MMTGSPGVTWQQFIVLDGGLTFARLDSGAGGYGSSRGGQAGPGYGSTAGYGGGGAAGGGGGYGVTAISFISKLMRLAIMSPSLQQQASRSCFDILSSLAVRVKCRQLCCQWG